MHRIALIDDHPLIMKGLAGILEAELDLTVCAQFDSAEAALEGIHEAAPTLVVTDVSLPGISGIELVKTLKEIYPEVKVLVISRLDEELVAKEAIQAGANGYMMKSESPEEMVKAVRKVLLGGLYLSSILNEQLLLSLAFRQHNFVQPPEQLLSGRELEIFVMLGNATTSNEMAERLDISVKTVESYIARIKQKFSVSTKNELMRHAVHWLSTPGHSTAG